MTFLRYLALLILLGIPNAIYWLWCKLTGRPFTPFGGPQ